MKWYKKIGFYAVGFLIMVFLIWPIKFLAWVWYESKEIADQLHRRFVTTTLYRPVGPLELDCIKLSAWREFPPRLPEQPIFYPVTNEEYAIQIARDWNVPASGSGFVTKFKLSTKYLKQFPVQNVGGHIHNELWVPAEKLEEFNSQIKGKIRVVHSFFQKQQS